MVNDDIDATDRFLAAAGGRLQLAEVTEELREVGKDYIAADVA